MTDAGRPIITLLTDFGTSDPYVGVCKGVILSRCPAAQIVDLTHEVEQGNVHTAGYLLATAWRYFPAGTVHMVVVDPGVGTGRRVLAASVGGQTLLAPDNGVLSAVLDQTEPDRVVAVNREDLYLKPTSSTFHGRDVFAPVAAALASGVTLDDLGPAAPSWIRLPQLDPTPDDDGRLVGQVVYVDRFGNLITNLTAAHVGGVGGVGDQVVRITIANHTIRGVSAAYGSADTGALLALIGSSGRLEISVNRGDAAGMLGVSVGAEVELTPQGARA